MMSDTAEDLRIGPEILKQQAELYRRLRNTLRWLLGSLDGFAEAERVPEAEMPELERWVLHRLAELDARVRARRATRYDWTGVYPAIHSFCATDLSAFYFDIRKDALYCDRPDSLRRRAARTVLDHLHRCLATWLAPVLVFTAEEAWVARFGEDGERAPAGLPRRAGARGGTRRWRCDWAEIRDIRRVITGALERARARGHHRRVACRRRRCCISRRTRPGCSSAAEWAEIAIVSDLTVSTGRRRRSFGCPRSTASRWRSRRRRGRNAPAAGGCCRRSGEQPRSIRRCAGAARTRSSRGLRAARRGPSPGRRSSPSTREWPPRPADLAGARRSPLLCWRRTRPASAWILQRAATCRELGSVGLLPVLNLTMVWNRGVTFGLLNGVGACGPILLTAVALAVVAALAPGCGGRSGWLVALALGAVAGGAVGNVIDRLRFGAVVDFIHAHAWGWSWYVFNVADAAIVCGVGAPGAGRRARPAGRRRRQRRAACRRARRPLKSLPHDPSPISPGRWPCCRWSLAGCGGGDVSRTFGLTRDAPDEFQVTTRAPLSMPPDFTPAAAASRRAAAAGDVLAAGRRGGAGAAGRARHAGAQAATTSPGQQALLAASGPAAPADIRRRG